MALSANSLFFAKFPNPLFHTDSRPCIRKGGPVAYIGGPVGLPALPQILRASLGSHGDRWTINNRFTKH